MANTGLNGKRVFTFWRQSILEELMDMLMLDDFAISVVFPCGTIV